MKQQKSISIEISDGKNTQKMVCLGIKSTIDMLHQLGYRFQNQAICVDNYGMFYSKNKIDGKTYTINYVREEPIARQPNRKKKSDIVEPIVEEEPKRPTIYDQLAEALEALKQQVERLGKTVEDAHRYICGEPPKQNE